MADPTVVVTTEERLREIIREELGTRQAPSNVLTAEEAAEMLKCSTGHVHKLARDGRIPATNIAPVGNKPMWRFHRGQLEQMIIAGGSKVLLREAG